MYSYGEHPTYPNNIPESELVENLEKGVRLLIPDKCPMRLYQIMRDCWQTEAHQRPTFIELKHTIEQEMQAANWRVMNKLNVVSLSKLAQNSGDELYQSIEGAVMLENCWRYVVVVTEEPGYRLSLSCWQTKPATMRSYASRLMCDYICYSLLFVVY